MISYNHGKRFECRLSDMFKLWTNNQVVANNLSVINNLQSGPGTKKISGALQKIEIVFNLSE
jgi:hypothetical protein